MRTGVRFVVGAVVASIAAVACGAAGDDAPDIVGSWDLDALAVDARVVPMGIPLAASQIEFGDDRRFRGRAPCNDFSGTWSFDGRLVLGEVIMSAADCVDPDGGDSVMRAEETLFAALFDSGSFEVLREGATLQLRASGAVLDWTAAGP